jgi:multimeric flavodoxin WrbA
MKVLAINGSHRAKGTTTRLTEKALEGAASEAADTEMIVLADKDVRFCTNCLKCYDDTESEIAPCVLDDDVRGVLEAMRDADGVIFSSPVHCGFVSGRMTAFIERATWTLCKPTGELLGMPSVPEPRLTAKTRAVATLVSAGGVPPDKREFCDLGTPWLKEMAALCCNGKCVGDVYAASLLTKELVGDERNRLYHFRELTDAQLEEAYTLGVKVAQRVKEGNIPPFNLAEAVVPSELDR